MFIIAHEDDCSLMESTSRTASVPDLHARMGEQSPQIRVSTVCTCSPKRYDLHELIHRAIGTGMPEYTVDKALEAAEVPRG